MILALFLTCSHTAYFVRCTYSVVRPFGVRSICRTAVGISLYLFWVTVIFLEFSCVICGSTRRTLFWGGPPSIPESVSYVYPIKGGNSTDIRRYEEYTAAGALSRDTEVDSIEPVNNAKDDTLLLSCQHAVRWLRIIYTYILSYIYPYLRAAISNTKRIHRRCLRTMSHRSNNSVERQGLVCRRYSTKILVHHACFVLFCFPPLIFNRCTR